MRLSIADLLNLMARSLSVAGLDENPGSVARTIALTERNNERHNGLAKLREYIDTLNSGWANGRAKPEIQFSRAGVINVDGNNGFAQPALECLRDPLIERARSCGISLLSLQNSHHYSALWPDVLPYAEQGLIALAFLNSRARMAPHGGTSRLFGTNPMAFASPRAGGAPLVWDQASSVISAMRLIDAAQNDEIVALGVGIDKHGRPTQDPAQILDGGAQLPYGGHKGSMIALMVEVMAAALTGGRFGFEDESARYPGARTSNAGQCLIVIDPDVASTSFAERVAHLCERVAANGSARVPGESYSSTLPEHDIVEVLDGDYHYALSVAKG